MTEPGRPWTSTGGGRVGRELLAALRRRRRAIWRLLGWSPLEALPALLSGYVTARAVDDGFLAGRPATGLGWLGLLALAVLIGGYGVYRVHRCLADVVEPYRDELLEGAATGALRHSAAAGRADTAAVSRLTHQVEIVRDTFGGLVMVVRGFLFVAGGALVGLATLAPVVVLLVVPPILLGLGLFAGLLPAMITWQRRYVLADERLAERTAEVVTGRVDVVAAGAESRATAAVGDAVDAQAAAERALARMAAARGVCLAVGGWLPLVVLLIGTPWLLSRGLTAGAVLGALVYLLHGLQPALYTLIRGLGSGGLRLLVTLDRLLATAAPASEGPASLPPAVPPGPVPRSGGTLVLRQVTFRYGRYAAPVLRNVDLTVPPGDHLAVVGPSGVGKSTVAGLLAGLLTPETGEVRLDGVDLRRLGPEYLSRQRVLIPQEAYVFTGTLRENLTYLRTDASPELIEAAVDRLGLTDWVAGLGGYDAVLVPARLSAGERQLVALARAYLSPAPLALLDEATCHLDPAAEARVERAFAARPGTLVVVAHRISSAVRARRVLVITDAEVTVDRHDRLLRHCAHYRDLVGHWQPPAVTDSDPTGVAGDLHSLDPGAGAGLADDPGEVVPDRPL